MKRDNVLFLLGGFVYGALVGFGIYYVVDNRPREAGDPAAAASAPAPAGPMAPTQVGATAPADGAPMMKEIAALKRHLQEHPDDLQTLTRLGNIYHDVQMWGDAVEYYTRALEIEPDDPDVITDLGVCYQGLQQYEKALEQFSRAQEADPTHWQSLYNTAVVAGFNLGQLDRAEAALAQLEKIQPTAPGIDRLRQTLEHVRAAVDSKESS